MIDLIKSCFEDHVNTVNESALLLVKELEEACELIVDCLNSGNKLIIFGNGGSAADAQHIAAEFTGRFEVERKALPAIALTTDTSAITAIGNDYGFSRIFVRQVEALAKPKDILIGISTSGNSENVVAALKLGRQLNCRTIGLSGKNGGQMNSCCDVNIVVPSNRTARIQEVHILIGHIFCTVVDSLKIN